MAEGPVISITWEGWGDVGEGVGQWDSFFFNIPTISWMETFNGIHNILLR